MKSFREYIAELNLSGETPDYGSIEDRRNDKVKIQVGQRWANSPANPKGRVTKDQAAIANGTMKGPSDLRYLPKPGGVKPTAKIVPKPGGPLANRPGGVSVKPEPATVNRPPITPKPGGLRPKL